MNRLSIFGCIATIFLLVVSFLMLYKIIGLWAFIAAPVFTLFSIRPTEHENSTWIFFKQKYEYILCDECNKKIGHDLKWPRDAWKLENGKTLCRTCCIIDLEKRWTYLQEQQQKR